MPSGNFPLATIRGIRVLVNWTWLAIFALVAWSLAGNYFPSHFKGWSPVEYWAVGIAAALLLFGSVLGHELSHSITAQSRGLPVDTIILFIFGGVSNLTREPSSAGEEFWIAAAGPLSSIVIGAVFLAAHAALTSPDWLSAIFGYLGTINLVLAGFNLIPAFPLDGGRVFRAVIWAVTKNLRKSTRIASIVGSAFAWAVILIGVWQMLTGDFVGGLWLAFIGWFLNNAATGGYRSAQQSAELQGVDVADVMIRNPVVIDPEMPLDRVVHGHLLQQGQRAVPVVQDGRLEGLFTVSDVRHFPPDQWPVIRVWRAMTPREKLDTVHPHSQVGEALDLMNRHGHNQLPVVEGSMLAGMVTRAAVLHYLQVRHELGMRSKEESSRTS